MSSSEVSAIALRVRRDFARKRGLFQDRAHGDNLSQVVSG
jgi:hypothetical protein